MTGAIVAVMHEFRCKFTRQSFNFTSRSFKNMPIRFDHAAQYVPSLSLFLAGSSPLRSEVKWLLLGQISAAASQGDAGYNGIQLGLRDADSEKVRTFSESPYIFLYTFVTDLKATAWR